MSQRIEDFLPPIQSAGFNTDEDAVLGGALTVTGAASLNGGVSGAATLTSLTVSGASTFNGTVATTALANFSGATAVRLPTVGVKVLSGATIAAKLDVNGTAYYITLFPTAT